MREIVHGLMLHVTMHLLCVMRQFTYDVMLYTYTCNCALLVRNSAVRLTKCYNFNILFLHLGLQIRRSNKDN